MLFTAFSTVFTAQRIVGVIQVVVYRTGNAGDLYIRLASELCRAVEAAVAADDHKPLYSESGKSVPSLFAPFLIEKSFAAGGFQNRAAALYYVGDGMTEHAEYVAL